MWGFGRRPKITTYGRAGIVYKFEGRALTIDSEQYSPPLGIFIYDPPVWKWSTPAAVPLTPEEKDRVLEEVVEHLIKKGFEVQMVEVE